MGYLPGEKKDTATEALFLSGIQSLNTGISHNDRELLEISRKQLELAANAGSALAEFFKNIVLVRLAETLEEIQFNELAGALYKILNDPSLEFLFLQFLRSFKETLEYAEAAKLIDLSHVAGEIQGTMEEILEILKQIEMKKNHEIKILLAKLHSIIIKFIGSHP